MSTKKLDNVDYLTLLGHVKSLKIPIYHISQIDCKFGVDDEVGSGAAMAVYHGQLRVHPDEKEITVALKMPKEKIGDKTPDRKIHKVLGDVRQELRMMKHLEGHPNIINLYGVAFRDLRPVIIVELAISNLEDYLSVKKDEDKPVDWTTKMKFCNEVADGLRALHTVEIVHGDVKGENILLFTDSYDESELICKIADFGYSATKATIDKGGGTGGTIEFLAPECTPSAEAGIKPFANRSTKDIYSYGLFVWQVASDGEIPFKDAEDIDEIKNTDKELRELLGQLPADTPSELRAVIVAMTKYIPDDRGSLLDVKEMLGLDKASDARYAELRSKFESNASALPRHMEKTEFESIEFISIPQTLKAKLFRDYEKAANRGDTHAAFMLAVCYRTGFGVPLDTKKVLDSCIKAATAGSLDAMIDLALSHRIQTLPVDPSVAFPWYLKAAEAGHREAQRKVAWCYFTATGVQKDLEKNLHWMSIYRNQKEGPPVQETLRTTGETSLHRAVRQGSIDTVRSLVELGKFDIDVLDDHGKTALHLAAEDDNVDLVKLLSRELGAKVDVKDDSKQTPLHIAATHGNIDLVRLLVGELGADINAGDIDGWTALHLSAGSGHVEVVRAVVSDFHTDVDIKGKAGRTALHQAANSGHLEVVRLLAGELHADVNAKAIDGRTVLHCAARGGYVDVVRALVGEFHADVNVKSNDYWTALHRAAKKGHAAVVRVLAGEFHANVNAKDKSGRTALHKAAEFGHIVIVKAFVCNFHADLGSKDKDGQTALHCAARLGHVEVVRVLARGREADISAGDKFGQTALHRAASGGHVEVVRALIGEFHIDVDVKDNNGQTALCQAAELGYVEVVWTLAGEFHSDVNTKANDGWTALHKAVWGEHTEVVKVLVNEFNADINAENNDGESSLHMAKKKGCDEIVSLFVEKFGPLEID